FALVCTLSAAIILAGCYVNTEPTSIARLDPRAQSAVRVAPWSGTFQLYRQPPEPSQKPPHAPHAPHAPHDRTAKPPPELVMSVHLKKGEALGFRHADGG